MAFFATEYTIHFDDTMAYGSHHFLTSFKFQCAAREAFLFGERVFDIPGVKEALDNVHLFTSDAYARNLYSTKLGDRIAILLTLEEWGRVGARFCYRVFDAHGHRVCAGFQTLVCADAKTGNPIAIPEPLRLAMDSMREIEERPAAESFRNRVLAGGSKLDSIFGDIERETAIEYLRKRYPSPGVIPAVTLTSSKPDSIIEETPSATTRPQEEESEAWVFAGQGAFDSQLLADRVSAYVQLNPAAKSELDRCVSVVASLLGGDAQSVIRGTAEERSEAIRNKPELLQVAIHLQNTLGGMIRLDQGHRPTVMMGHSFGEIAALGVGGCFDLATGIQIVCLRALAIRDHAPSDGQLLVVFAKRHAVEAEIQLQGLHELRIAGRNHDLQTVVSGPAGQLDELRRHMQSIGISTTDVPGATSFHHPRLRTAATWWQDQLKNLHLASPNYPIYSPIGRRWIQTGDDLASVLANQLIRPFDLQGAVHDMIGLGVQRFVDCGSLGSLAKIISKSCLDEVTVCVTQSSEESLPPSNEVATSLAVPVALPLNSTHSNLPASNPVESSTVDQAMVPVIAIVGQGCILPGGAKSSDELFTSIIQQRMGIVDQRNFDPHWSEDFFSETLVADRSTSHLTGRVNDEDIRVPWGVDPAMFEGFTRTQRLLCIALAPCVASLKGAQRIICLIGSTADGFEDQDVASSLVYSGIEPTDPDVDSRMNTARSANRTAHDAVQEVFDRMIRPGLQVTLVDAACASSLYTVALGMQSLENDAADAVIAGGFFCPGPGNSCLFSQFKGTTSTGCRPFDVGADGVVFSEGAALVTLRRAQDARSLGLNIDAVVRGVGLSSDGRSSSANVPQSKGQIISLRRCYSSYQLDPTSIHAIEAHGTSTPVGDSTEVESLRQFFSPHASHPIPVHSLKSTLGHAGWAAGTASLIAACEYMRRGTFPGQAFFNRPSEALAKSSETLVVAAQPTSLARPNCRIAVDGFGFGGANAHLVVEQFGPQSSSHALVSNVPARLKGDEDELVIVACHQSSPTLLTANGFKFDRTNTRLPKKFIVLPELADDMDISQTLAVIVTSETLSQLSGFDDELRRDTSVVLALRGKTERGVEATMRVMSNRFRRNLAGKEQELSALDQAYHRARPSRSYTLQCMMPNVAAGRAALLLNLNGPNFVVDAGDDSLRQAFVSASLLIQAGDEGGTRLAIVSAIEATAMSFPDQMPKREVGEYAVAFGMTTRGQAQKRGWPVMKSVNSAMIELERIQKAKVGLPKATQIQTFVESLKTDSKIEVESTNESSPMLDSFTDNDSPLHTPVFVERSLSGKSDLGIRSKDSMLVVVPNESNLISRLLAELPHHGSRWMMAIVGDEAQDPTSNVRSPDILRVCSSDIDETSSVFRTIRDFSPDAVAVFQNPTSWDFENTLARVADDNRLCEFLFLLAKSNIDRLQAGSLDLWSLVIDGFNGVLHPQSGPLAGLLKSIHREIPAARMGSVCTSGLGLGDAISHWLRERCDSDWETEVVYNGNVRLVRRLRPISPQAHPTPQVQLDANSVVIATGGARGVTGVMLEALVRDYRCTVVAFGRSPLEAGPENPDDRSVEQDFYRRYMAANPDSSAVVMKSQFERTRASWEAYRTIQDLNRFGGRVEYRVVDVTDRDQVTQAVSEIANQYGRVDLLIHGAGVQFSKRLENRTLAEFRKTFSVKVVGLKNVVECCRARFGKTISAHVLTSAYSIFGNDGQHDYGAANETMDRVCSLRASGLGSWTCIPWLAWEGIGMTRGSEYRVLAKRRSLSGVTPDVGQRIFRDVITGRTGASVNVPISVAERVKYGLKTVPRLSNCFEARTIEVPVALSDIECLTFHRIRNTPTLPGAWIIERMVSAAKQLYSADQLADDVTIRNASFMRFVRYSNGQDPNIRIIVHQFKDSISVQMISDVLHSSGQILAKDVLCARASLDFSKPEPALPTIDVQSFETAPGFDGKLCDPYCQTPDQIVDLSGHFDCLNNIEIGVHERRASFLPNHNCDWVGEIPSLLLDATWRVGAMYSTLGGEDLFVPVQIDRMVLPVRANTPFTNASRWEIRSTNPQISGNQAHWGRTEVIDSKGQVRLLVENASASRIY
jgi:3-oxoacyl-(acyl-carrier-protein) synthase/NAD(P)-dependent dehydrogenase (short-subunit alcohol dehydrogenase family)/acyl-CoA thioesterase FadM